MINKLLYGLWVFGLNWVIWNQKIGNTISRWAIRQRNKRS